jgi:hypothetical protein
VAVGGDKSPAELIAKSSVEHLAGADPGDNAGAAEQVGGVSARVDPRQVAINPKRDCFPRGKSVSEIKRESAEVWRKGRCNRDAAVVLTNGEGKAQIGFWI